MCTYMYNTHSFAWQSISKVRETCWLALRVFHGGRHCGGRTPERGACSSSPGPDPSPRSGPGCPSSKASSCPLYDNPQDKEEGLRCVPYGPSNVSVKLLEKAKKNYSLWTDIDGKITVNIWVAEVCGVKIPC